MYNQAVDPYLGYIFQGYYSLIVLLDAGEDEAISIETRDDIELHGNNKTLYQLKHSLGTNIPILTIKSVNLWNTLRIWATSDEDISKFILITCSKISNDLKILTQENKNKNNIIQIISLLDDEAKRIIQERKLDIAKYKDKFKGCETYIKLDKNKKKELIKKILIKPDHFNITETESELDKRLKHFISKDIRAKLIKQLLEWWNPRIVNSLLDKRFQKIEKVEVQEKIAESISSIKSFELPDIFSTLNPSSEDINKLPDNNIKKQIKLVDGGESRIRRALISRWRARNQRDYWIQDKYCSVMELENYDTKLFEGWYDRHSVIKEQSLIGKISSNEKKKVGRELLDWADLRSNKELSPIKNDWNEIYLNRGSYHELVQNEKIGWHPDFPDIGVEDEE